MQFLKTLESARTLTKEKFDLVFYAEIFSDLLQYGQIFRFLNQKIESAAIALIYTDAAFQPLVSDQIKIPSYFLPRFLLPAAISRVKSNFLVTSSPYLGETQAGRPRPQCHSIYLFHSLNSTVRTYRKNAFQGFDYILAPGPAHMAELRLASISGGVSLEAGYPLLDLLSEMAQNQKPTGTSNRLFFGPTWGTESLLGNPGRLAESIDTLLRAGYEITFRPHPMSLIKASDRKSTLQIKSRFSAQQNFKWSEGASGYFDMLSANALITDQSSISMEFTFATKRPSIFISGFPKVANPDWREYGITPIEMNFISKVGTQCRLQDLPGVIEEVLKKNNNNSNEIERFESEVVSRRSHSASWIADFLAEKVRMAR